MCSELIEAGIAVFKDMTFIQNAINSSKGYFNDLQLDKLAETLKKVDLIFYQKAYLAVVLTLEQRTELFKKMGFDKEQDEAYTLDKLLFESKKTTSIGKAMNMVCMLLVPSRTRP